MNNLSLGLPFNKSINNLKLFDTYSGVSAGFSLRNLSENYNKFVIEATMPSYTFGSSSLPSYSENIKPLQFENDELRAVALSGNYIINNNPTTTVGTGSYQNATIASTGLSTIPQGVTLDNTTGIAFWLPDNLNLITGETYNVSFFITIQDGNAVEFGQFGQCYIRIKGKDVLLNSDYTTSPLSAGSYIVETTVTAGSGSSQDTGVIRGTDCFNGTAFIGAVQVTKGSTRKSISPYGYIPTQGLTNRKAVVTKLYNQFGSINLNQSIISLGLIVVENGNIVLNPDNNLPAMKANSANFTNIQNTFNIKQPNTIFLVAKSTDTTNGSLFRGSLLTGQIIRILSSSFKLFAGNSLNSIPANTNTNLHSVVFNNTNSQYYINNTLNTTGNTGTNNLGILLIPGQDFDGYIQELIIFNSNKNNIISNINTNINNYYNIY